MKAIKKFMAVIVAFVMSLTIAVFAACTPVDKPDDKDNNITTPGGDEQKTDLEKAIDAILASPANYAALDATVEINSERTYSVYENGEKTPVRTETASNDTTGTASGKINILDGDMDLVAESNTEGDKYYSYAFARDWALSIYSSEEKVTDFNGKTLQTVGNLKELISSNPIITEILGDTDLGELASAVLLPVTGASVLALGDEFDALTVNGGDYSVDVNLLVYNLLQRVNNFLKSLTNTTTIGELLAKNEVKELINAFTAGMDGAAMQTMFAGLLEEFANTPVDANHTIADMFEMDIKSVAVAADANSTAYDYIIKVVKSNELKALISEYISLVTEMEFELPVTVDKLVLNDLLQAASNNQATITGIQQGFEQAISDITKTQCPVGAKRHSISNYPEGAIPPAEPSYESYLSGFKVTYTVTGSKLTKMSVDFTHTENMVDVNLDGDYNDDAFVVNEWQVNDQSIETSCKATLTLTDTGYTLTDLSGCEFEDIDNNPPVPSERPVDGKYIFEGVYVDGVPGDIGDTGAGYIIVSDAGVLLTIYGENDEPVASGKILTDEKGYYLDADGGILRIEFDAKKLALVAIMNMGETQMEVKQIFVLE